jgi:hypothetical protein
MYLPIAEMSVDPFAVAAIGGAVGVLSGLFGVGGGFLLTPLLMFYGIPPAVAVGTGAAQIVASSVSGTITHVRRGGVDFQMGRVLILGGALGAVLGVVAFRELKEAGQIDTIISVSYVVFLTVVGLLMLAESLRTIVREPPTPQRLYAKRRQRTAWMSALPMPMRFRRSQLYISPLPPLALGVLFGVAAAIMGIGGGFVMIPAMIYILQMPTNVVVGTSLFQVVFVAAITTVLHAAANFTVDVVLMLLLAVGAVIGSQLGARLAAKLKAEQLRALLALAVLGVGAKLLLDLVLPPDAPYLVEVL